MADQNKKPDQDLAINLNLDTTPILYTDSVYMTANKDGVVFDVMQRVGNTNQARVVARFGMSREHAKKCANELSKLLALTEGHARTGEKNKTKN